MDSHECIWRPTDMQTDGFLHILSKQPWQYHLKEMNSPLLSKTTENVKYCWASPVDIHLVQLKVFHIFLQR